MNPMKVFHQNLIGHEINVSLNYDYPVSDREIYCKRLHKITEPEREDCQACPYYAGLMMGHGHECVWEDYVEPDNVPEQTWLVPHKDVQKEYMRVSKLIDEGLLKKG